MASRSQVRASGSASPLALHVVEGEAHHHRQFVHEGGLERGQPVLRHADQGCADGLMRAAFARQRDARRRRHQQEPRILVAGVIQRIQPARDEGIVERAHRQQPYPEQLMRQAQRRQQQEQVHLGDAQLDMLSVWREIPHIGRRNFLGLEDVLHMLAGEQFAPVHPAAQIGRDRDVGRGGDDAVGEGRVAAPDLGQDQSETLLGGHQAFRFGLGQGVGDRQRGRVQFALGLLRERHVAEECFDLGARQGKALELVPFMAFAHMIGWRGSRHLRFRHQAGVIVLVALPAAGRSLSRYRR